MRFATRQDAGHKLGCHLAGLGLSADLVLGLPRGGVVVAAGVAKCLRCPVDVLVVRKLGHPQCGEFAIGALGEGGVVVVDTPISERARVRAEDLKAVIEEEMLRLLAYQETFARPHRPERQGKVLLIVDDGLATGATLEAAAKSARQQGAQRIIAAVPVASSSGAARMRGHCDEFHALCVDPRFEAVGQYYDSFAQTTDESVRQLLGL